MRGGRGAVLRQICSRICLPTAYHRPVAFPEGGHDRQYFCDYAIRGLGSVAIGYRARLYANTFSVEDIIVGWPGRAARGRGRLLPARPDPLRLLLASSGSGSSLCLRAEVGNASADSADLRALSSTAP
jgi:hypothetical protein